MPVNKKGAGRRRLFPNYTVRLRQFAIAEDYQHFSFNDLARLRRQAVQGQVPYDLPWRLELLAQLWRMEQAGLDQGAYRQIEPLLTQFRTPVAGTPDFTGIVVSVRLNRSIVV